MADLFDKCVKFVAPQQAKEAGFYPYFHKIETGQNPEVIIEGRKMIMVGSNNYLGLTSDWRLKMAAIRSIQKYGVGCVGSRFLNGTLDIHEELERELARFVEKEAAIVFSTGMQANLGVISAIIGRDDVVIMDKLDHASIIDGCRLSYGRMLRYEHNNMDDLEKVLSSLPLDTGKLIVVDGVFSMEGDTAPLPQMVELKKKYNARLMVDDAHGLGVYGKGGRGTPFHYGVEKDVDLIMGTFSKSFATVGGFIAGDSSTINFIKHHARSLIFSASLTPPNVASALAALEIIKNDEKRRENLWNNTRKIREGLKSLGFNTGNSESPIIPVIIGDFMLVLKVWRALYDRGIFTTPVVPPAVPAGRALIRVSMMATHTDKHIEQILRAFEEVGVEFSLIEPKVVRMIENKEDENSRWRSSFLKWMGNLWKRDNIDWGRFRKTKQN